MALSNWERSAVADFKRGLLLEDLDDKLGPLLNDACDLKNIREELNDLRHTWCAAMTSEAEDKAIEEITAWLTGKTWAAS